MPVEFTPADYMAAESLGILLDDPCDKEAATTRLMNTMAAAYQKLDEECAHVHQVERDGRAREARTKAWRNRLIWALAVVAGIALGEGWMLCH